MSETPISPLRARMIEDMSVRKFGEKTQKDYIRHVKTFSTFLGRSPATATGEDLRQYQVHQSKESISPATMNGSVAALRFFFRVTLNHPELGRHLTLVPLPERLRVVLSQGEVAQLLEAAPGVKYKAAFSVAYGAGLRVSEVAHLKVSDIESKRMLLRIEQGRARARRTVTPCPQAPRAAAGLLVGRQAQDMAFPGQGPLAPHHDAPAPSGRVRNRRSNRDQQARDTPRTAALFRVLDYSESLGDSGDNGCIEPALLGIILTPPKASPLPLGGLHEQLGWMLGLGAAHTPGSIATLSRGF